jgi:hypothetical protein
VSISIYIGKRKLISGRIFEVAIIVFSLFQQGNNNAIAKSGSPNHAISNTISDILFFIPGVTASLVVFLVFGTTKSWRQYRDLVVGGCGVKRRIYERRIRRSSEGDNSGGLEFERLPSLPNQASEDNAIKVERRVRMFVTSIPPEPKGHSAVVSPSTTAAESSTHTRAPSALNNIDIHKPRFADMAQSVPPSPTNGSRLNSVVGPSSPVRQHTENPVTQYGPVDEDLREEDNSGSRRFVSERLPKNGPKDLD